MLNHFWHAFHSTANDKTPSSDDEGECSEPWQTLIDTHLTLHKESMCSDRDLPEIDFLKSS